MNKQPRQMLKPYEVQILLEEWKSLVAWLPKMEQSYSSWEKTYITVSGVVIAAYTQLSTEKEILIFLLLLGAFTSGVWYCTMYRHYQYARARTQRLRDIEDKFKCYENVKLLGLGDKEKDEVKNGIVPKATNVRLSYPVFIGFLHFFIFCVVY